jgi:hypothetical protein
MSSEETRTQTLKRITELLEALEYESRMNEFDVLAYLISMAFLEAQQTLEEGTRALQASH